MKSATQQLQDEHESRAAFEAWAKTVNKIHPVDSIARKSSGEYLWSGTSFAWECWQACNRWRDEQQENPKTWLSTKDSPNG